MAEQRMASPVVRARVGTATECPRVAELITYALGQCSSDERSRIDAHLEEGECPACKGWIEKAAGHRAEPWPQVKPGTNGHALHQHTSPTPVSDETPIPPSYKWQQAAFRDLEERLRALDENS